MADDPGVERIERIYTLPPRSETAHKGHFGRVLVVAGSRGYAGAAALTGAAALRSGAGLVRIATATEVQPTVASFEPSYMTYPLPQDEEGLIDFSKARGLLEKFSAEADVVAIGPGLGRSESLQALVLWALSAIQVPLILDADALNALEGVSRAAYRDRAAPWIATPHPGELARWTGQTVDAIQSDREAAALELARGFGKGSLVVVLKGAGTIVSDGRRVYLNPSGNPGMATGGSGDVLTGVIAAMVGQRLPVFEAAVLGVYAHGLAGDVARDHHGEVGMIAGDLVDALPDTFAQLAR